MLIAGSVGLALLALGHPVTFLVGLLIGFGAGWAWPGLFNQAVAARFADLCRQHGAGAVDVAFCGPTGLLEAVRGAMKANGVPVGNLRHELFEFR